MCLGEDILADTKDVTDQIASARLSLMKYFKRYSEIKGDENG